MDLKFCLVLILLSVCLSDSKRSRGRSRGSSSSGTSFWNRKNSKGSDSTKPSAPKEPDIKKQTSNVQQSEPQSRPIGWNVDNNAPKTSNVQKQNVNPSHSAPNPSPASAHPNPGVQPPPYSSVQHNPNFGQPNAGYGQHNAYNPGYGQQNAYNPGYGQHNPSYGHNPGYTQRPPNYGQHGHNPNYGPPPPYPGYSNMGHGGYSQQTGMFGNRGGFGGGGYGGYGGYGMKKSGGFFGKHAFRNVLGGLFVYYLVSGLVSRPYKVYNYYNQPVEERKEMTLPANVLTLCSENATNICVPGTTAICTQDEKILCVSTMTSAVPCKDNNGLCVNTTIPCLDSNDPLCKNNTTTDNTTTVNLPCFTNMTLQTDQMALPQNITLPDTENNKYCVTAMAVPDPSLPVEDDAKNATVPDANTDPGWGLPAPRYASGFNNTTLRRR